MRYRSWALLLPREEITLRKLLLKTLVSGTIWPEVICVLAFGVLTVSCTEQVGSTNSSDEPIEGYLVINEIVASPEGDGTDWIELLALGDGPIELGDYALVDDNSDHVAEALPDHSLEPGDYYVVVASREPPLDGSPYVSFQLGGSDSVTLSRDGLEVDTLVWLSGEADEGMSWGRLPDGTGDQQTLNPTRGAANEPYTGESVGTQSLFVTDRVVDLRVELDSADWAAILASPRDEVYYPANIVYDGAVVEEVAFRTKGNSSLSSSANTGTSRLPFKIDLNYYVEGQELLGETKLVLNNGFKDPSCMRDFLANSLAREFGLPAPRASFVNLYINDEHIGLYTLVEAVDGNFVDERFEDDDGDLYKPEPPAGNLTYSGESAESYSAANLKLNEETSDLSAFVAFVSALNGLSGDYEDVMEVDQALRFLAFHAVLVNLDSYLGSGHNYYMYEQEGVFQFIPWDMNEAWGHFGCGCDREELINLYIDEPICGSLENKPLVARLLEVDEYRATYEAALLELVEGLLSVESMQTRIEETADLIRAHVAADPTSLYGIDAFETALYDDPAGAGSSFGLLSFIEERGQSVQAQLDGTLPRENGGAGSCANQGGGPGPGQTGGPGQPGGNPCGDGVCDQAEQGNPDLCPADC